MQIGDACRAMCNWDKGGMQTIGYVGLKEARGDMWSLGVLN